MREFVIGGPKLPPVAWLVGYLLTLGVLSAIALVLALLLLVGYLFHLLLASVHDVCVAFGALPAVVQLLFLLLSACAAFLCMSYHLRRKGGTDGK